MAFLNQDGQYVTSARDNGNGEPITDVYLASSEVTLPVDIQGIQVSNDEKMPVERAPYTEYKQGDSVSAGIGTLFNHTVEGSKIGLGIRWETATNYTIEVGYVVPGTENNMLIPYEEVLAVEGADNGGVVIEAKNKFARIRITNNGAEDATIASVTVVDF